MKAAVLDNGYFKNPPGVIADKIRCAYLMIQI